VSHQAGKILIQVEIGQLQVSHFGDTQTDVNDRIPLKNPQIRDTYESSILIIP
jgi:hypothetical protein